MRRVKIVIMCFGVASLGAIGYGGYNLFTAVGGLGGSAYETSEQGSRELSSEEIETTAKRFLTAWASGEAYNAAQLTTNALDAEPVLVAYKEKARVSEVVIVPGRPMGAKVPFTVKATVAYQGHSKPWTYSSELTVMRGLTTGRPLVEWRPSVIHPLLTTGASLVTSEAAPTVKALDRYGKELTKQEFPSLGPVLDTLADRYGAVAGGTPRMELFITAADENVPRTTLVTLAEGNKVRLQTYLDARVQAAAEQAVTEYPEASVVALEPGTGQIRAVANSPAEGFNAALQGAQAPASTMKIVTAAMMLEKGLVKGPNSPVQCPATVTWEREFHNLKDFSIPRATLKQAFARSCNTAFIKPVKPLGAEAGTALRETARKYFGIGLDWQVGIPTRDGSVPTSVGAETAASYIGQGRVQMNALNMASVAATVKNGSFRQPVLVPVTVDDRKLAAAVPLPTSMASTLRQLMSAAAHGEGTAASAMASVSGAKGAKTGSAEVDSQGAPNSWFTGYTDRLAAAAVVGQGGHGGDTAGLVVAQVLRSGQGM
ncbi:penicillin-binding transpeptidase domain-containing protein [Streptomyces sp. NPDC013457]|uniref:penicillin-binding transpeptidase domain-containing protein n=1 Tax=Streptomyces sp. NPDC013457 TaxID=3364866 RepID=UPI003700B3E7